MTSLNDSLYDVCRTKKSTKELWESLDQKYKIKEARAKMFVLGHFLNYKILDSKTVINQVQEIQVILHEIHSKRMERGEAFQVAVVIEMLPLIWKDFKNYLKYKP